MTIYTIKVFNRQNTTVFTQLKTKIITHSDGMKWLMFSSTTSFDFTFAVLYLHYYGKQHQVK